MRIHHSRKRGEASRSQPSKTASVPRRWQRWETGASSGEPLEWRAEGGGWRHASGEQKWLTLDYHHNAHAPPERRQLLLKLAIFSNERLHALLHFEQRARKLFKPFWRPFH